MKFEHFLILIFHLADVVNEDELEHRAQQESSTYGRVKIGNPRGAYHYTKSLGNIG